MWKHLVGADEENKKEFKKLQSDNKSLKEELVGLKKTITYLEKTVSDLERSKLVLLEECNRQINLLRTGVSIMNRK